MTTILDKAGRVVIPVEVRKRLGLTAGTKLEVLIEGSSIWLVRAVAGPQLARRGERLVAVPQAAAGERTEIDVAQVIDDERGRRAKLPLVQYTHEARPGEAMTPQRVAEVLNHDVTRDLPLSETYDLAARASPKYAPTMAATTRTSARLSIQKAESVPVFQIKEDGPDAACHSALPCSQRSKFE